MSSLVATLGLNTGPFHGNLNSTLAGVRGWGMRLNGILAGLGAGVSIGAIGLGMKKALDVGGSLTDLSAQTGASAGDLAVLQQAFTNAGMSADKVGPSIARMRRTIADAASGSAPAAEKLDKLGLSAQALGGMGATGQLKSIGDAIAAIENPTARAAAAMDIFGEKSGAAMLSFFSDSGALAAASEQLGAQAGLLTKNAALFDSLSDSIGAAGLKLQGLFVGVLDQLAPAVLSLANAFNKLDLSGLGQQIGGLAAFVANTFATGNVGKLIGQTIAIGVMGAFRDFDFMGITDGMLEAATAQLAETLGEIQTLTDQQQAQAAALAPKPAGAFGELGGDGAGSRPTIGALFSSSMAKIGGGGAFVGNATDWTMRAVEESRKQTGLLEKIANNTKPKSTAAAGATYE